MRKILVVLVLAFIYTGSVLGGDCTGDGYGILEYSGTQRPDDDEFLYKNKTDHTGALAAFSPEVTVDKFLNREGAYHNAWGYECDRFNSESCTKDDTVIMPAEHVFMGKEISVGRTYKCNTWVVGNDSWQVLYENECRSLTLGIMKVGAEKTSTDLGEDIDKSWCDYLNAKIESGNGENVKLFKVKCVEHEKLQCLPYKCEDGYELKGDKCVIEIKEKEEEKTGCILYLTAKDRSRQILKDEEEASYNFTADELQEIMTKGKVKYKGGRVPAEVEAAWRSGKAKDPNAIYRFICGNPFYRVVDCVDSYELDENGKCVKKGTGKTCRERRKGMSREAIACCDTGNLAEWTGTECKCKNPKTEFKIDGNGTGKCIPKAGNDGPVNPPVLPVPSKDCPDDAYPSDDNKTCICNDDTNMMYDGKECVCRAEKTVKEGNQCKCTEKNKELKNGKCEWSEAYLATIKIEIDKYYSKLTEISDSFKVSEWRDAEGKFNTARLASDSIAGVVLGTVGGVVTANLVKKAQVKQGFEDLQCYIGGQSVADYGDGFVVGR